MNFRLNRLDTMAHLAFVGCSSYNSYFKQSKIEQKKKSFSGIIVKAAESHFA